MDRAHIWCPRHDVACFEAPVEVAVLALPQILAKASEPLEERALVGQSIEEPQRGWRIRRPPVVKEQMGGALAAAGGRLDGEDARHARGSGAVGSQSRRHPARLGDAIRREERHERRARVFDRGVSGGAGQERGPEVHDLDVDSTRPKAWRRVAAARVHHDDLRSGNLSEERANGFYNASLAAETQHSAGKLGPDVGHRELG